VNPRRTTVPSQVLGRILDEARVRARAVDSDHAGLWESVAAATEGGKRFRPALLMAAHDALGGRAFEAAAEVAAALELLHTAFVIHDDVIDGDEVRRGRLNPAGTFSARARSAGAGPTAAAELGRTAGILAGDLALTTAIRAVARCGAPADVTDQLLDLFDAALHTTAAGELADVRLALGTEPPSVAASLAMEEQKTGAYSFALPLQAGAVLAGSPADTVARLGEAGGSFGIAFQLLDDLIGVFGDPALSGKSTTADLRSGKRTPLLVHALAGPCRHQVREYVGRELTEDELADARRLLVASGSRDFVQRLAERHLTAARAVVEDLAPKLLPVVDECFPMLDHAKEAVA